MRRTVLLAGLAGLVTIMGCGSSDNTASESSSDGGSTGGTVNAGGSSAESGGSSGRSPSGSGGVGLSGTGGSSTGAAGTAGGGPPIEPGMGEGGGPPGEGWSLMFVDTFSGTELDETVWHDAWAEDQRTVGFSKNTYLSPNNHEVKDGILTLYGRMEPEGGLPWSGALIQTWKTVAGTYGYIESRFKFPAARGSWPAFWLVPTDRSWPPEIDIMENHGSSPWLVYHSYHYWKSDGSGKAGDQFRAYFPLLDGSEGSWDHDEYETTIGWTADYHVYAALWEPGSIRYYIDGVEYGHAKTDVTDKEMYVVFDMKMGGWGPDPDETTPDEMKFDIDWVRWWQRD